VAVAPVPAPGTEPGIPTRTEWFRA
jgi:hypothetical protein